MVYRLTTPLFCDTLELSENNSSALSVNDKHECACASCALFTDKALGCNETYGIRTMSAQLFTKKGNKKPDLGSG
jgi:hypothetical protein